MQKIKQPSKCVLMEILFGLHRNECQITDLFQRDGTVITKHISNIFKDGELAEKVVCSVLEHTTAHVAIKGKTQGVKVKYYNLDAILSVGYRVNSVKATQFRIWATQRLKEHLVNSKLAA